MLFSYKYVHHQMENMQEFINFIFCEVWCNAPAGLDFTLDLFELEPNLREVLSSFGFAASAPERGKKFYKDIKEIYGLFAVLTSPQIDQFRQWYQANNEIEKICANDPAIHVARYADISAIHPDLSNQLASFFKGLYSQELLDLTTLRDKIGQIEEHYQAFMRVNTTGICPFCGLSDIKGVHNTKREAYDHYLPKSLYPFNSINFHNLAPACHECNSTYKLSKDPVHNAVGRRKSFYPYCADDHEIEITIELDNLDIDHLLPENIQLTFGPTTVAEEIETWKEVYGIEERYRAKCCSESGGKYWLTQVLDEWREDGRDPADHLRTMNRLVARNPVADANFLKKAFLEGCQQKGVFDNNASDQDINGVTA